MIHLLWGVVCEVFSRAFALAYPPATWLVLEVRHLVRHLYGEHSDPSCWPGLPA